MERTISNTTYDAHEEKKIENLQEKSREFSFSKNDDMEGNTSSDDSDKPEPLYKRQSYPSIELRRQPIHTLLVPADVSCGGSLFSVKENFADVKYGLLGRLCLRSRYSIRTQMMLTFGLVDALTILLVMAVCIGVSILSGINVKGITQHSFDQLAREIEGTTARYLAEHLSPKMIPEDIVNIIQQAAQERFVGYPDHPGYEEDILVPFWDIESQTNKYPIRGKLLPMDWQLEPNLNDENYMEHVQNRLNWYERNISTATGNYIMQGMCDPFAADPTSDAYYPNCTEANNNVQTGGVVAPSPHNHQIHNKLSDLNPLLKALYEYHQELYGLGLYFANGGSGASMHFPHFQLSTHQPYTSIGCDWLLETPHPYDSSRSIISDEKSSDRIRNGACRPNNVEVSSRTYNPMERGWCRNQVVNPHKIHVTGPYLDAWTPGLLLVTVGRAIYDKVTSEFIACISVDFIFDSFEKILGESRLTANAQVSIVRNDDMGTVVASTAWSSASATTTTTIDAIDAGVSRATYQQLSSLVDYSNYTNGGAVWNATQLREAYEQFGFDDLDSGYHMAGYPIPPPPENYDSYYEPEFFVIVTVPTVEVHEQFDHVIDQADEEIYDVVLLSILVGLAGLVVIVLIIIFVSHFLTSPLQYMNDVANDIFETSFSDHDPNSENVSVMDDDSRVKEKRRYDDFKLSNLTPRTEIYDVVREFQKMVTNFSHTSMARSMHMKSAEVTNEFTMVEECKHLYFSRTKANKFKYNYEYTDPPAEPVKFIHLGANNKEVDPLDESEFNMAEKLSGKRQTSSSLFFWILILMVLPFLVTTIAVSAVVITGSSHEFGKIINDAQDHFVDMEKIGLDIYAGRRAHLASAMMERSARDLHLLTRYAGWLLFDGIKRENSFTEMIAGAFIGDKEHDTCDCVWDDVHQRCFDPATMEHRHAQKLFWATQSQDNHPNGDRNESSYPEVAYSRETVTFYQDVTSLPGSEAGSFASGPDTTYSRTRSLSAIPIMQALYDVGNGESVDGVYIGTDAGGSFYGYACDIASIGYQTFSVSSTEIAELLPDICPYGKFGYDPRCREWYMTGKKLYMKNGTSVFVTAPYLYSGGVNFGQSMTAPLADPVGGEYIGQTLIDFLVTPLFDYFSETNTPLHEGGFPILITVANEIYVDDAVIGPGYNYSHPQPIADVVFADDPNCNEAEECSNRGVFNGIVDKMKMGLSGAAEFSRTAADGSEEVIHMSYAPVQVKSFQAIDYSDFSRGVNMSEYLIYSVALAETEQGLLIPFKEIERDLNQQMIIALVVLITVIGLASLWVTIISYRVALSISEPMLYLLELITHINRIDCIDNAPEIDIARRGHSLEVVNVSKTIESLYKVIRSANVSFFTGDLEQAYYVLHDVLKQYRRWDNKKGISIACNNLGNLFLTMYRALEATGDVAICGFKKRQIVSKGMAYFHEAIQLGEKAYDAFYEAQGWSPVCLEFMQHLSNRYFNRAMFLLTVKDSHEMPKELEELGFRDLQIARDMDLEIIEEGTQAGWGVRSVDRLFDVSLCRLRGLTLMVERGYPDEYEISDRLEEGVKMIRNEVKKLEGSLLFNDMNPAGRMQQIEMELMKYKMLKGDVYTAAQVAVRMLMEDEYTMIDTQLKAVEVLIKYVDSNEYKGDQSTLNTTRRELQEFYEQLLRLNEDTALFVMNGKLPDDSGVIKSLDLKSSDIATTSIRDSKRRSSFLKESLRGDFTMEIF